MLNNVLKVDIKTPAMGIIQKSCNESFFLKFHQNSKLAENILDENPMYNKSPLVVLQVMLINESCLLAECVRV